MSKRAPGGGDVPPRVVLIEDSEPIRKMIGLYLASEGMQVFESTTVSAGRRAIGLFKPQIVLLDLGLEDGDGAELLPEMVSRNIPCMVISARSEAMDRVASLENGAHDYMTKPIDLRELLLRMRRMLAAQAASVAATDPLWAFDGVRVDQAQRAILSDAGGAPVRITAAEFALLRLFAKRVGQSVERAELAKAAGLRAGESSRALDIAVSRLRRKLRDAGHEGSLVSVRGSGYQFAVRAGSLADAG